MPTHAITTMVIASVLFITICFQGVASSDLDMEAFFNKKAEDMFDEQVGNITQHKNKLNINQWKYMQKFIHAKKSFKHNKTSFDIPDATTEKGIVKLTPLAKTEDSSAEKLTMEDIRLKIKKQEVNALLRGRRTMIPNFKNDEDDPNLLTQLFDMNISTLHSRRVYYHKLSGDDPVRMYNEKLRLSYLMMQFIYMTRRQMSHMTVLRNKYKKYYKYQIGYLFGLYRMVKQQQGVLQKTLMYHHIYFDNAQISLQFYYRIVMLGVDLNDIMRYILKLNYLQKKAYNPTYYWGSAEYWAKTETTTSITKPPG